MNRDALVVDLCITRPTHRCQDAEDVATVGTHTSPFHLRAVNVHLESLALQPPLRPAQLAHCKNHVNETEAGFIAGDFNAIESFDDELAEQNGLIDAWAALHLLESGDESTKNGRRPSMKGGETWGIQVEEPFPPGRLDRIALKNMRPLRMKVVLCEMLSDFEEELFWSDHCGLLAELQLDLSV
jgi:tyrosyl-DNA phosphodiesterase 2